MAPSITDNSNPAIERTVVSSIPAATMPLARRAVQSVIAWPAANCTVGFSSFSAAAIVNEPSRYSLNSSGSCQNANSSFNRCYTDGALASFSAIPLRCECIIATRVVLR